MSITTLRPDKGTYLLIFKAKEPFRCRVGKLGLLAGQPGFYAYVGSAQGPGGVAARIKHHLVIAARPHWHLDYLRPHLDPMEVWCTYSATSLEHQWAYALLQLSKLPAPLSGFGASDCRCETHLAYFNKLPATHKVKSQLLAPSTVAEATGRHHSLDNNRNPSTTGGVQHIKLGTVNR